MVYAQERACRQEGPQLFISTSQGHSKGSLCWPGQGASLRCALTGPSAVSAAARALCSEQTAKLLCGAGLADCLQGSLMLLPTPPPSDALAEALQTHSIYLFLG